MRWVLIVLMMLSGLVQAKANIKGLTEEESLFLQQKKTIKYCVDPAWMPFESIDRHGRHEGASSDFVKEFSARTGVKWQLVPTESWSESIAKGRAGECEVLMLAAESEDRKKHFNFTSPYISLPVVVVGKRGMPYVDGVEHLHDKTISLVEGYILVEMIQKRYPEIALEFEASLLESLRSVAKGKADATLATLPTALYQIQKHGIGQLEIAGYTDFSFELSLAVNNQSPMLTSVLNKLVASVESSVVDRIVQRWYTVEVKQATDYKLLVVVVSVLSLVVGLLLYRNRLSSRFSQKLAKVNARLTDRNARLEQLTQHDYLTGVYNRMYLDQALELGVDRFATKDESFQIIMLDIDGFSKVNLEYGHAISDLVLVEFCHLIEEVLPDWTSFGRWEGDCFLIVCPKTMVKDSHDLTMRLLGVVANHRFQEGLSLTISVCTASLAAHESAAAVVRRAELALEVAKPEGRQQTVFLNTDADLVESINDSY